MRKLRTVMVSASRAQSLAAVSSAHEAEGPGWPTYATLNSNRFRSYTNYWDPNGLWGEGVVRTGGWVGVWVISPSPRPSPRGARELGKHNAFMSDVLRDLMALTQQIGDPAADCIVLAEGNASAALENNEFYVKASGFSMATMDASGFLLVRSHPILDALDGPDLDDAKTRDLLCLSRVSLGEKLMPSTETFMHAFLLSLPGVRFVAHTHPTPLLSLLSLPDSERIAAHRLFPDEIVCCGPSACYLPYADPGLPLARAIRSAVLKYVEDMGMVPRTIWVGNHGLIALGETYHQALAATVMSVKSARGWLGALSCGTWPRVLTKDQIERIHTRPDEHYRQRLLAGLRM